MCFPLYKPCYIVLPRYSYQELIPREVKHSWICKEKGEKLFTSTYLKEDVLYTRQEGFWGKGGSSQLQMVATLPSKEAKSS